MGASVWPMQRFKDYSQQTPEPVRQTNIQTKPLFKSFKKLAGAIWKPNYERAGLSGQFSPEFYKVIGVETPEEYDTVIKFLFKKAESFEGSIFFAHEVPASADFDMISYLSAELSHMNLQGLEHADIQLFSVPEVNQKFLQNLSTVVNLYEAQYQFMNQSVKIDFIVKMMLWMYTYVKPIENTFNASACPKCLYYGDITKHESFFLLLVYFMGIDILYINPLKDSMTHLPKLDFIREIKYQQISQIFPIMDRVNRGEDVNLEVSTTAQLMDEIQNEIFNEGNLFQPWQLKDHEIKPCKKNFTIYDLKNNIGEPAKVRDGFKVEGNVVTTPNVFFQIDGVTTDPAEYNEIVSLTVSQPDVLLLRNSGHGTTKGDISDDDILRLVFCRVTDRHYSLDELRKLPFYTWNKYNPSIEKKLFSALNRLLNDNIFSVNMTDAQEFRLVGDILSISEEIIKLLDNYDYAERIPKVVFFLENETFIIERSLWMLGFIYELGFDIVIFNPSGLKSISSVIDQRVYSHIRNEKMVYDMTLSQATSKKKAKGFFSRLFQ